MNVLYDTRTVHPLDRYEYARCGAATELAPVAIRGRTPGDLLAVMSVTQIGEFTLEVATWAADREIVACRTDRLIRACDPEAYRIYLSVNGGVRMSQADVQTAFGPRDVGFYDLSRPFRTTHTTGPVPMRVIMLTFPRGSLPIPPAALAPLTGTVLPRGLPGRGLTARLLIGLTDADNSVEEADVLRECTVSLISQWLGRPHAITPNTRRLLHLAHLRGVIGRLLGDPGLDPAAIAAAANISERYLHKLFQDTELTPMQLVKRLRLERCLRRLRDPASGSATIRDIAAAHGYLRADQFARDFKQLYGISASEVRREGREG